MSDPALLLKIVEDLEWSGQTGSEGAYMGGPSLSYHGSCPECGGLDDTEDARGNFTNEAFGHRSGCRIAETLGRPTVVREGETGNLTL